MRLLCSGSVRRFRTCIYFELEVYSTALLPFWCRDSFLYPQQYPAG